MKLQDVFASDGDAIFRNLCDFGEVCDVWLVGAPAGVAQPLAVLFSTSPDTLAQRELGLINERTSTAIVNGHAWRSAVFAILGTDRGPRPGDVLRVESGEHAGDWTITAATPAPGNEYELNVTWQTLRSLGQTQGAQP